jgi:ATP-dependent DNA ligase
VCNPAVSHPPDTGRDALKVGSSLLACSLAPAVARFDSRAPTDYLGLMLLRTRRTPSGFIKPCLPSPAERPPSGPRWIHEIKHDGFRLMARRDCAWHTTLLTRNGRSRELDKGQSRRRK